MQKTYSYPFVTDSVTEIWYKYIQNQGECTFPASPVAKGGVCSLQDRIRGDASKTTIICVDNYKHGVLSGRYYSYNRRDECHSFESLMQLIVGMEHILDSANDPQSFTALRSFAGMPRTQTGENVGICCRNGDTATFVVKVLFRQHTSWQGSITWLEADIEQPFRSVLELILLMESALNRNSE